MNGGLQLVTRPLARGGNAIRSVSRAKPAPSVLTRNLKNLLVFVVKTSPQRNAH